MTKELFIDPTTATDVNRCSVELITKLTICALHVGRLEWLERVSDKLL